MIHSGVDTGGGTDTWFLKTFMHKLPLDPKVADTAPSDATPTRYDHEHVTTYMRLLAAEAEGAQWEEAARIVLHIDPDLARAGPRLGQLRQPPCPR
jgi:hypothetical protein